MHLGEAAMFLAVGFIPTLIALEMVCRWAELLANGEKFHR
jgi:hypothetical protein